MAEMRNAVQEIGGAVQRIDHPEVGRIGAGLRALFLEQEAVVGARLAQLAQQNLLDAMVGRRDEIRRTFLRHLKLLDFAEVAQQAARRLAGGVGHDVDERRAEGGHGVRSTHFARST